MNPEPKTKRRIITPKQTLDICNTLSEILLKNENDLFQYKSGWNDVRVAEKCGVTFSQVQRVRSDIYGDIRKSRENVGDISKRLNKIEQFLISLDFGFKP